ncbi:MAG: hypothetical protein R3247_06960, partial [Rhodothermales bacterium]|nr:hypothetical protein [Rhodothermales bacterium]
LVNVTNRAAYDNQPFFTPDGQALLYTAYQDTQTDIYRADLGGAQIAFRPMTRTPESEYSPTPLPGGGFSTVRVEADGTQRLWRFDADGAASLVLDAVAPVGYHAWADDHTVALFVLGDPPTLQLADTRTGRADTLARNIGRSLHRVPGSQRISFVQKGGAAWTIRTLDPATGALETVTETLPEREDYAWTPDGRLLMADGAVLYEWTPESEGWRVLVDFTAAGITNLTRLAVSPDGTRLALVADRPQ